MKIKFIKDDKCNHCWHMRGYDEPFWSTVHEAEVSYIYYICCLCSSEGEEKHGAYLPKLR